MDEGNRQPVEGGSDLSYFRLWGLGLSSASERFNPSLLVDYAGVVRLRTDEKLHTNAIRY